MVRRCANCLCLFEKDNCCSLEEIEIDCQGRCMCCLTILPVSKELLAYKQRMRKQIAETKVSRERK